jgi:RNA polymerase sigma factor (sigma-70 family)
MSDVPSSDCTNLSDSQLLARFVRSREEAAFRAMVERHGPLVLGVCRRGSPTTADADDAFQATFLVLAQSAHKIRGRASLAAWLYGVAFRVSARLRRERVRHATQELLEPVSTYDDPLDELLARHDELVTDEELAALPESLRTPLVLRYLVGKENAEVAKELGITVAALEGRLKRAKQRLRMRLIRRGVTLAAAVAVLRATKITEAGVPESLVNSAVSLGMDPTAELSATNSDYSSPLQLAEQEIQVMNAVLISKPIAATIAMAVMATLAVGVPLAISQGTAVSTTASAVTLNASASGSDDEPAGATLSVDQSRTAPRQFDLAPRSASEMKIRQALAGSLQGSGLDFHEAPLVEIASFLQDEYDIQVLLDTRAMDDVGIAPDEPVSISVRGISLSSAMRLMLRKLDLTYMIDNEVLLITTMDVAESKLSARVYPTNELEIDEANLIDLLTETIATETWAENGGGEAQIVMIPNGIVVSQTYAVHEMINDLFRQLAEQRAKSSGR